MQKLARIPQRGRLAHHGRSEAVRGRNNGYDYLHVAVDDATRVAYIEVHPREQALALVPPARCDFRRVLALRMGLQRDLAGVGGIHDRAEPVDQRTQRRGLIARQGREGLTLQTIESG